jgi:transporter family-2 protein
MLYLLSLLAGVLISVMVVFNGGLNARAGHLAALVVIHLVGTLGIAIAMLLKKERPRVARLPLYLYIGGFIGVMTTVFNNLAFGHISVSAMMALGLLGESLSGLAADHYGILGLPRRPFRPEKLWGIALTLIGIVCMITELHALPVAVSLLAGGTVLLSRLLNGQLAARTSVVNSTFFNYLMGLLMTALLYALMGNGMTGLAQSTGGPLYIYLGGALGVIIVLMSNFIVGKIPSFYMTLALFVGQVMAGLLLDMALSGAFSARNLLGGLFVLAGLVLSLWQDRAWARRMPPPLPEQASE